jgi:anti-anti-sigma factor
MDDRAPFEITTSFEGPDATLTLRGSIENLAAFDLAAALDATIDRHPTSVLLDLSELDYVGAAGLVAVANAEKRLEEVGARLTIRSPSALVARMLGMVEVAELNRDERALPDHRHLGPEQLGASAGTQRDAPRVSTQDLRRITAMPTDPEVVDGALGLVVELAYACVGGADGVSVSLLRHGVLRTVAASDQIIMSMDADQYATGEGPCVDASVQGHWFHAESLDRETRWPSFTPRARELGIKAILSSPLKAFDEPVGALNIYSRTASAFEVKDQEVAGVFAQKASVILSDARVGVSDAQMASRFTQALRNREIVSLAKGVIMEREGVDEDEAFSILMRLSLDQGLPLHGRAEAILRSARQPRSGSDEPSD